MRLCKRKRPTTRLQQQADVEYDHKHYSGVVCAQHARKHSNADKHNGSSSHQHFPPVPVRLEVGIKKPEMPLESWVTQALPVPVQPPKQAPLVRRHRTSMCT
jgi:hypothetical protein